MNQKIRIVLADDHLVFTEGLKALLNEVDAFEVVGQTTSAEELLEKVKILKPDIVITDIHMPGKDGVVATTEIKSHFPEVRVIALTMQNESIFIRRMLEAGAAGYILKSVSKEELITAIRSVAAGQTHFSEHATRELLNNFNTKAHSGGSITKREKEILLLIAEGLTDKAIAEQLNLSPLTVITHRKSLLSKLNLKNKADLTRYAIVNDL